MRIPIVDFAEFSCGQPSRRATTATALRVALERYGFLYLRNHGVPESVLDTVLAQSRRFFALSQEAKLAVKSQIKGSTRGYGSLGSQALDEKQPGDLKEIFQAGPERPGARPNVWPEGLPGFREAVLAFQQAAMETCNRLMGAIAVSLGLAEGYFAPYHDRSDSTARLLHYPPVPVTPLPGQIRAGVHTDFGGLSLLFQDEEGGLEIQGAEGVWIAAPALPGIAIVNTGDLVERWTNGQFRSSPHRVVNPIGPAAARHRYSVVLFHSPNPDAVIECLAPCQSPERQPRYPPITVGEHMLARIRASRPGGY
jgi:isopenicillin N synthase-like dioxygenase